MTNAVHQIVWPKSLFWLTAEVFVNAKIQSVYNCDHPSVLDDLNVASKIAWDRLKESQHLTSIASDIENLLLQNQQDKERRLFSKIEKDNFLKDRVDVLFKNLAKEFHVQEKEIPVDPLAFCRLQEMLNDEALQTIWDKSLSKSFRFNGKVPKTPSEIKLWLEDKENLDQINAIECLNFSDFGLKVLPPQISEFSHLQGLYLDRNKLKSLPESIGNLSQLHTLWISDNKISRLPESLSKLSQLREVRLEHNEIRHLPEWFGSFPSLFNLELRCNRIRSLPQSLGRLSNLVILDLDYNDLEMIPESLGDLTELKTLFLNNNKIKKIPDSLSNLSNLLTLGLNKNEIEYLPEALRHLHRVVHKHNRN